MNFVSVTSSNIAAVAHDGASTLHIRFNDGSVYRYTGVPAGVYQALLNPPGGSVGKYFHAHVRDKYPTIKL